MNSHKNFLIFLRFLQRDIYVYRKRLTTYALNYGIIYPTLYSFSIGYLLTTMMFGAGNYEQGSALFIGHILPVILVFANILNVSLLFDLENTRFIDYQITVLNPRLVVIERILFTSLFTFLISTPFYPIAKLILGDRLVTTHASWPSMFLILYVSALCCSAYTLFCSCIIPSSRKLRSFWMRINFAMMSLGGLFIPWHIVKQVSPALGYALLLNPITYISEGLRSSLLGSPDYMPVWLCTTALISFATIFIMLTFYFFKKRVDHI